MAAVNPPQFAIGDYKEEYDNYRKATEADVTNHAFQAALVKAHGQTGWPFLGDIQGNLTGLHIDDKKLLLIDGAPITHAPLIDKRIPNNNYYAINAHTWVPWTTTPPESTANWAISSVPPEFSNKVWTFPCLFVHKSYNSVPKGGSRRSRRYKRRNYVKKQKKRTRKH